MVNISCGFIIIRVVLCSGLMCIRLRLLGIVRLCMYLVNLIMCMFSIDIL